MRPDKHIKTSHCASESVYLQPLGLGNLISVPKKLFLDFTFRFACRSIPSVMYPSMGTCPACEWILNMDLDKSLS